MSHGWVPLWAVAVEVSNQGDDARPRRENDPVPTPWVPLEALRPITSNDEDRRALATSSF